LIGFLLGFAMFGAISYLPLFQQVVQGASATNSGLLLLPMMAGLLVTSLVAGQLITRTGHYKIFPILGGVIMVAGMLLLSTMSVTTGKAQTALFMATLGLGMGFLMQTTMLIAQNSVGVRDLGVASSAATFFRSIGGSFGVSLAGAIFNRTLTDDISSRLGPAAASKLSSGGVSGLTAEKLKELPSNTVSALLHGIATASSSVFFWATFVAVLVPVLAVFIKNVPLRGSAPARAEQVAAADEAELVAAD
jgi:hypothetical protein